MATVDIFNMADTWNAIGTTFNGIYMNFTDGAGNAPVGAAASRFLRLDSDGTSVFDVSPSGVITVSPQVAPFSVLKVDATRALYTPSSNVFVFGDESFGEGIVFNLGSSRIFLTGYLAWQSAFQNVGSNADLFLLRDAAQTLAQRNSTTAQTFRVYETFTDATNYERASLSCASNTVTLAAETAGTGADDMSVSIVGAGTGGTILKGTGTNDSAAAGKVGEIIESTVLVGAPVGLTSATPADVTSISLTAGDWDVWGNVWYTPAAATSITIHQGAINTTSATLPTAPGAGAFYKVIEAALVPNAIFGESVGQRRISVASTTTVYLVTQATFTLDTLAAYGYIGARRIR